MIDMKQLLVRDHIARLEGEAAAHRAARASNEAPTAGTSTRVRLGRWLVGVGTLIAGTSPRRDERVARASAASGNAVAVATKAGSGPCDDGSNLLSSAA